MFNIWYVRDGAAGNRMQKRASMTNEQLRLFANFNTRFSARGPAINPDRKGACWYAKPKHVVIETECRNGPAQNFSGLGFYHLLGLTPQDCEAILGRQGTESPA
jgi:hypothetical protein